MNQQNVDRYQRLQAGILKIHNKSFPVYEGVNTVGRQREAIVNIKHLNISQNHAVIVIKDGSHFISDLNSSNGSFIGNRKVEPFKLYELKHNIDIKLGDLNGSYITEGPFTNNDQTCFEMTQDVTQSFYGSNTQIVDISKANNTENEFEDIHEAPTQEISWAAFKIPKNIKPVNKDVSQVARQKENSKVPSEKSEEDIYNCNTQVISEPASSNEKKSVDASIKPNICNDDEDIHDAPTQIFPISSNYKGTVDPIVPEPEIFGPFNDECLPFLEDNDNYNEVIEIPEIDKASDIHEAETQVVDICKKIKSTITETNMEDDEATDCEDITNIELNDRKANPELSDTKPGPTNTLILNQDEETDCEDNTQDDRVEPSSGQQNKNGFLQSDEGSNDSMEFFKLDRSNNKDSKEAINKAETDVLEEANKESNNSFLDQPKLNVQMDNSSDESIRFKKKKRSLISDTDSEDEEIGYKRKNKSAMVISTQDICENDLGTNSPNLKTGTNLDEAIDDSKKLRSRESYIINDTDSETEVDLESKVCLEESIAPTQNQSTADLNDTDCIPATQDVITECTAKLKSKIPKRLSDNINGSSEESFKLGLTELMDNPSQAMGNNASSQDPCCSKIYKNPSPIFGKSSSKNRTSPNENVLKDTEDTDIYLLSTQKTVETEIRSDRINKTSLNNQSALDMYLAPTQKIVIPEKLSEKEEDNSNETECFYDMPTQKVDVKEIKNRTATNKSFDETNNDTFLAPTQKVLSEIPKKINETPANNLNETECLYDLCTQKIDVRDLENPIDTKSQLDGTNNDIYFAPTQKIFNEVAHTDKDSSLEESMDDLFLQTTQQSDDTFNQPTQKVNKSDIETESKKKDKTHSKPILVAKKPEIISLQNKKKFSFKKQVSNLDGSLTSILDHKPVQSQSIGREKDRSSIEIEFSDNAFNETADRPSNPLSYILDNPCQVNNPLDTEGKVIINEIPLEEKFTPEDENNQEKIGKHINIDAEQNVSVQCRNDTKSDNNVGEVKGKINMTLTTSSKGKINAIGDVPSKLGKTRSSRQSCVNEALESNNKSDLIKLELQSTINEVNKKTENESDMRPPRRRTKRLYSSSSDIKTNSNLDIKENKLQVKTEQTDNSLNATNSEVNQSVALLESKVTRTRKTMKSSEVQVKVPKNRKSMSILDIDAIPESSDKYQNINNNDVSKITRERKSNKNNKLNDDTMNSYPSTSKSITSKKRGGSKLRQTEDRKIDVKVEANNNSETSEQTCPPLEIVKEEVSDVISSDTQNTRRMRKASAPTSKETRQVGKRKHPADKKPDDNDSDVHSSDINLTTPKKRKQQPSRQVGKRKQITEVKSENSDSSIHSVDSNLVTPKKQKIEPNEALLNTKERGLRKQKPKVVFTMLESPQLESMIKQLGGSVVDTVDACTVLVTEHVKRSQKLLAAVGLGKPICSPKWITDSKKAHEFLDPWDYILTDKEAETKWKFSLKESLSRSRTKQLLDRYNFNIQVTNAAEVLKGAIESCGGKCITKIPSQPLENTFIISTSETRGKHKKITKQHANIKVIEPEAIFDGVLRQELRFSKHYLT